MIRDWTLLLSFVCLGACGSPPAPTPAPLPVAVRFPVADEIDVLPEDSVSAQIAPCPTHTCAPQYPTRLRNYNIEASLIAVFVVDTTGRAEQRSVSFVQDAREAEFRESVCANISGIRFTFPPGVPRRRVLVLMPVQFMMGIPSGPIAFDVKPIEATMRQTPRQQLFEHLTSLPHCASDGH